MPSRSFSRGRKRARSSSRGSGMYAMATSRSRSRASASALRVAKLRSRRPRVMNTHMFSRYGSSATFVCTGLQASNDFTFQFDQIFGYSEFAALCDRYMIQKVVLTFQLITNPDSSNVTNAVSTVQSTNWYPKLWYIRDYDGGSTETIDSIKERQGVKCKIMRPNSTLRVTVVPRVLIQTYRTSTTTGYAPKRLYIDIANGTNVPHYGLKTVFDTNGVDPVDLAPFAVRVEQKYYFSIKDIR